MSRRATVVFVLPMLACPALAQTPGPKDQVPRPEQATPPSEKPIPGAPPQGAPSDAAPKEPLSEKLHEQEGVLKPPQGLDPGIRRPAPDPNPEPGRGPVITPPGEPGGDQSIQPK